MMTQANRWLHRRRSVLLLTLLLLALVGGCEKPPPATLSAVTVGDVFAVHAAVHVGQQEVYGQLRVSDGDTVSTGPEGRARLRLDDGTLLAVDASTRFSLRGARVELQQGRLFVQTGNASRSELALDDLSLTASQSAVALEHRDGKRRIYCAQGELQLAHAGTIQRLGSGESAQLENGKLSVAPEKAFDDWTGGLAVPWSSPVGEKSAIPEVRSQNDEADPGTPLVIRAHHVHVELDGELALTKTRTTYFNGGAAGARAHVRLALPLGAILRRVAQDSPSGSSEASVGVAAGPSRTTQGSWRGLEWAGGGWLVGDLGPVNAGQTLDLELEYVEWLSARSGRTAYRYPMAGGENPPLVSELNIEINASARHPQWVTASSGANLSAKQLVYRRADVRPTGDVMVEWLTPPSRNPSVRAYVTEAANGEDPYVMLRTEVPEKSQAGVTFALVVDSSMSVGPAALETSRAVVDAILDGLGPSDSVVAFAADQGIRALGPAAPQPVTPALRAEVKSALGSLRAAGASNLGVALQHAADVLDAPSRAENAGSGMVVYVGDGRPTVGEPNMAKIRRLLGRRAGLPRLSSIAIGAGADRWALAKLVQGIGSMYEVGDRTEAARAGAGLLAEALQPTLRDVQFDLGPSFDRIYPRDARAVLSGTTVTVLGRLRGKLPEQVTFRLRDGASPTEQSRAVMRQQLPAAADVAKRWASARVDEMLARDDEGIEPAIALAAENSLLTPWTSWFFQAPTPGTSSRPFRARVLDLSPEYDTPFAARVDELGVMGSTLLEPPTSYGGGVSLEDAVAAAIRRTLQRASSSLRACRDARASVRPDVGRRFSIELSVNRDGEASKVNVQILDSDTGRDAVLERCIATIVRSLPYFAAGAAVTVQETVIVADGRSSQRTQCSAASKVSLPLRRSIWRARSPLNAEAYLTAARGCELPRWADRRDLLLLILEQFADSGTQLHLARALDAAGEADAASFVRREALRRVTSFAELDALSRQLTADEPAIDEEFEKAHAKVKSDAARLGVVRRFLRLAPHNPLARRHLLAVLEALGMRDALVAELEALRAEPFVDAGLIAAGASALRRMGLDDEGRRLFGELIERAPGDPWTLAYVGDRLRAEGLFDEACTVYDSLARALPYDAAVTLRLALAHAGAGRLDVATRLLERVTQTGGRGDDGRVGELSSIAQAVLLAGARGNNEPSVEAELTRRLLQTPLPDVQSVVFIQSAPGDDPVEVSVVRKRGEKQAASPDLDAKTLGVAAIRIERGDGGAEIRLKRSTKFGASQPTRATVSALVLAREGGPKLVKRDVEVQADGSSVQLQFDGETFL
jgi:tetratricopeptide (TPR) repeat protein